MAIVAPVTLSAPSRKPRIRNLTGSITVTQGSDLRVCELTGPITAEITGVNLADLNHEYGGDFTEKLERHDRQRGR